MIDTTQMNFDTALALIRADDAFPVDFDMAWQWLGYSSKGNARRTLLDNFEEGLDFLSILMKNAQRGRPSESIKLSLDCFKAFCMMAGTEKGKEVRRYFLQCERQLKQLLIEPSSESLLALRLDRVENRLNWLEAEQATITRKKQARLLPAKLTSQSQVVWEYLRAHSDEKFSAQELAQLVNLSYNSLRRVLIVMYRQGLIKREPNPDFTNNRAHRGIPKYLYAATIANPY